MGSGQKLINFSSGPSLENNVEEKEVWKIFKVDENEIYVISEQRIITVNHKDYLKEKDVPMHLDIENSASSLKLLPPTVFNCHAPVCRLGCICSSLMDCRKSYKSHCRLSECMFECTCQKDKTVPGANLKRKRKPETSITQENRVTRSMRAGFRDDLDKRSQKGPSDIESNFNYHTRNAGKILKSLRANKIA